MMGWEVSRRAPGPLIHLLSQRFSLPLACGPLFIHFCFTCLFTGICDFCPAELLSLDFIFAVIFLFNCLLFIPPPLGSGLWILSGMGAESVLQQLPAEEIVSFLHSQEPLALCRGYMRPGHRSGWSYRWYSLRGIGLVTWRCQIVLLTPRLLRKKSQKVGIHLSQQQTLKTIHRTRV